MADSRLRVEAQNVLFPGGGFSTSLRVEAQNVVVSGGQAAEYGRVTAQHVVLPLGGNTGVLRVPAQNVVVIAAEGVIPPLPEARSSFAFYLDGHFFYGIHVEGQGTFVLDRTTNQWAQYASGSLELWNARYHIKWNDTFYASSLTDNSVVSIDPDSVLDDSFRVNEFTVTGRLESQSRRWIANADAQLFGSIGLRGGAVNLSFSDNEGDTFSPDRTVNMAANARDANIIFYNLGSIRAPGRIYKITDEGALRRIQSLKVQLGGGDGDS